MFCVPLSQFLYMFCIPYTAFDVYIRVLYTAVVHFMRRCWTSRIHHYGTSPSLKYVSFIHSKVYVCLLSFVFYYPLSFVYPPFIFFILNFILPHFHSYFSFYFHILGVLQRASKMHTNPMRTFQKWRLKYGKAQRYADSN